VINTIAGIGVNGMAGAGGPAISAQIGQPTAMAVDKAGDLFFADTINNVVWSVSAASGKISIVAGTGTPGFSGDGGPATSAQLYYPEGLAVDGSGNIYISDTINSVVRKVVASTGLIETIAGVHGEFGYPGNIGDGGPAAAAYLNFPRDLAIDTAGNLYIADSGDNEVRVVSATTGIITSFAGNGNSGFSGEGGPAISANLGQPNALAFDSTGNLYIGAYVIGRVVKVTATTGIVTIVAGNGIPYGSSGDGGPALSAEVYPLGLAVDSAGNVYIANWPGAIREVAADTGIITKVAGNGYPGYSGDGESATAAQVQYPQGIVFDASGHLYIADTGNYRVRVVTGIAPGFPKILALSPNYGAIAASISLSGNFGATEGDGYVQVNGAKSQIVLWSNNTIIVRAPYNGTLGLGSVVVTADGLRSNALPYTLYAFPTITNVSVAMGTPGAPVTITGTNLLDGGAKTSVTFSGTPATVTSDTAAGIQVIVPTGATSGPLRITVNGVSLEAVTNFVVEPSLPNITGVSPNYGAIAASISLSGNFGATEGAGYVQVNGAKSQIVSWSNSAIIIRVPYNGAPGLGSVVVTADGLRSNAVPFTLYAFPTITNISVVTGTPGTPVTITGTNLLDGGEKANVTFNGTPARVTSDTAAGIQVSVPTGATSGQLRVTVNGVSLEAVTNFVVEPSLPNITGISTNYGAIAASVNLSGNFGATEGAGYVQVNGAKSQIISWSNSAITVRAPYNGALGLGSVVVTADGQRSNAVPFTLFAFPTITDVSVTIGSSGSPVTITGTNLLDGQGKASVTFNGTPATITSETTTGIQVTVPTGASSGQLRVTVNGVALEALANFVVGG
jgi:sugar lactone lactonase YvrE